MAKIHRYATMPHRHLPYIYAQKYRLFDGKVYELKSSSSGVDIDTAKKIRNEIKNSFTRLVVNYRKNALGNFWFVYARSKLDPFSIAAENERMAEHFRENHILTETKDGV